jgi:pimeloyl-ACP methyl ester carboxylesterase
MGRSLGTGVATYVATLRDVNKLVLVTPYDSVVNVAQASYWMFPVSLLLKDHYDSLRRVAVIKAKTLVLLAENDQVIKRQHSENLLAAFRSVRPESVVVTGATHNNISDYNQYTRALRLFLENRH